MTTLSHETPRRWEWLRVPGLVESIAISAMWIAVAVAAVWGGDFVSTSAGGNSTTIPSGIAVAMFATIASWLVAKHGPSRAGR